MELLESLALHRGAGGQAGHRVVSGRPGQRVGRPGDYERAKELYEEGLALSRELGGAELLGAYLISLGYVFLLEGDLERATALNEEAVTLYPSGGTGPSPVCPRQPGVGGAGPR